MRKFISSKSVFEMVFVSVFALLAVTGAVMAATTIGTDITTAGNIYATSSLVVDGASTFTSTVTVSSANLKITTGYGLDSAAASGVLNIGTTTATTINIGSVGATVAIKGNMTFPTAYGLDSAGAVLNIGTTTATTINIGSVGAVVAIKGNMTFPTAYGIDSTGVFNIGTSSATAINIGKASITTTNLGTFSTATSTVGGNATTTTEGVIMPTSRTAAPVTCSAAYNGGLAYNSTTKNLCICIGTTWVVASSSAAVTCF